MVPMKSTTHRWLRIGLIAGERKGFLAEAIYSISQRYGFPNETTYVGIRATARRMVSRQGVIG